MSDQRSARRKRPTSPPIGVERYALSFARSLCARRTCAARARFSALSRVVVASGLPPCCRAPGCFGSAGAFIWCADCTPLRGRLMSPPRRAGDPRTPAHRLLFGASCPICSSARAVRARPPGCQRRDPRRHGVRDATRPWIVCRASQPAQPGCSGDVVVVCASDGQRFGLTRWVRSGRC